MRNDVERIHRHVAVGLLVISGLHAAGCTAILTGGYIIRELATSKSYTVNFKIAADADRVYRSLVEFAKQKNTRNIPIIKDDPKAREFEAGNLEENWGWKVWPVEGGSEVAFSAAFTPERGEDIRQTVRDVLEEFFNRMGVEYRYEE